MFRKLILVIALLSVLAATQPAEASRLLQDTSIVVGNGTPQSCTDAALRSAIKNNRYISFNCGPNPVTILITGGEILISSPKVINGAKKITLDAQGRSRVFNLAIYTQAAFYNMTIKNGLGRPKPGDTSKAGQGEGGAIFANSYSNITVVNMTFIDNQTVATGGCQGGGAINLGGANNAVVSNSIFVHNKAMNGGAIKGGHADLTVSGTLFDGNEANYDGKLIHTGEACTGGGGAILMDSAKDIELGGTQTISISNSVFRNNKTGQNGGAFFAYVTKTGTITFNRTTFETNRAIMTANPDGSFPSNKGRGGAIFFGGHVEGTKTFTGKLVITNSTINKNHADYTGGGISLHTASMIMSNTTIANNEAINTYTTQAKYQAVGGGIAMFESTTLPISTRISNVTITANRANVSGGGVFGSHGTITTPLSARLENSIIANNVANGVANNCNTPMAKLWGNVQYPNPTGGKYGVLCSPGTTVTNPRLGTLSSNGGKTKTVPLLSGSGAINHGNTPYCTRVDQRGYARNGACDSGAFEYGGIAPTAAELESQENALEILPDLPQDIPEPAP